MQHDTPVEVSPSMPIVLLIIVLLHNIEEALTYGIYRERSQAIIQQFFGSDFTSPTVTSFHFALVLVSLAAALAMGWVLLLPARISALVIVRGFAWIMLLNVLIPHVPAAFMLGGYSPGLLTASVVNLPITVYILVKTGTNRTYS
tara:strand:- start:226 stop:660 length:435 start_codon:yes stop_codon:yes gene_type:complete